MKVAGARGEDVVAGDEGRTFPPLGNDLGIAQMLVNTCHKNVSSSEMLRSQSGESEGKSKRQDKNFYVNAVKLTTIVAIVMSSYPAKSSNTTNYHAIQEAV